MKKTLYIECQMGAAGDMLAAAFLEIVCRMREAESGQTEAETRQEFVRRFQEVGIPGVELQVQTEEKNGITGTHLRMLIQGKEEGSHSHTREQDHAEQTHHAHAEHTHHEHADHAHRSLQDIRDIIQALHLEQDRKDEILQIYQSIAEAEGKVHGKPAGKVHFHEVGTMDALADLTAACLLLQEIAPDEIVVSPVATGYGTTQSAHGILPVPAPATALLLQGIPVYAGEIEGELCTPTGAALLRFFATRFGEMPTLHMQACGYGLGTKTFARANCVRVFLGETETIPEDAAGSSPAPQTVIEISCQVDDMTGEEIGFAMERLFASGALDVYTIPIYMKKNRPGQLIRLLCTEENKARMVQALFRYTSTIGIREATVKRHVLSREVEEKRVDGRTLHKKSVSGYGISRAKWEYEELAEFAREQDVSLRRAAEIADSESFRGSAGKIQKRP